MSVYIDDSRIEANSRSTGRPMRLSIVIADETHELAELLTSLGLGPRSIRGAGEYYEHAKICESNCRRAVAEFGARRVKRVTIFLFLMRRCADKFGLFDMGRSLRERLR